MIGEAGAMKTLVEKIARAVSGKHTAGAIGAVRGGRESQDQELGVPIAEAGNGLAPVFPVAKRETLLARDFFAVEHKARAFAAADDLLIELFERVQNCLTQGENVVPAAP